MDMDKTLHGPPTLHWYKIEPSPYDQKETAFNDREEVITNLLR